MRLPKEEVAEDLRQAVSPGKEVELEERLQRRQEERAARNLSQQGRNKGDIVAVKEGGGTERQQNNRFAEWSEVAMEQIAAAKEEEISQPSSILSNPEKFCLSTKSTDSIEQSKKYCIPLSKISELMSCLDKALEHNLLVFLYLHLR